VLHEHHHDEAAEACVCGEGRERAGAVVGRSATATKLRASGPCGALEPGRRSRCPPVVVEEQLRRTALPPLRLRSRPTEPLSAERPSAQLRPALSPASVAPSTESEAPNLPTNTNTNTNTNTTPWHRPTPPRPRPPPRPLLAAANRAERERTIAIARSTISAVSPRSSDSMSPRPAPLTEPTADQRSHVQWLLGFSRYSQLSTSGQVSPMSHLR